MATTILVWIKRILAIGILEFLTKVGWRVWVGIIMSLVGVVGALLVLTLILIALLF